MKVDKFRTVIIYIIIILLGLVCLLPLLNIVAISFSSSAAVEGNMVGLIPVGFSTAAYEKILEDSQFWHSFLISVERVVLTLIINFVLIVLMAYPLSKTNAQFRGRNIYANLMIFAMLFNGGMIPNYLLVSSLHLTGTRWAMLLPFCISQFNLIIMINSFKSLPHELEEAALIDGLGYWGILRRIIVPLSTAAIATVGLYYAVFFWNDWFNSLIYLNKEQYPVMLFLRNIVNGTAMVGDGAGSADKSSLGIAIKSAVIIVSTLPIIILYPFLQKYFVKGLTVGGVKG